MRVLRTVLTAAVGVVVAAAVAAAQDDAASYPNRPIKIIVPFAAGGTTDVLARIVGQALTAKWGQPVIIENRGGAGATLGADMVAKSPPDGYTLLMGATHHTIAQSAYARVPYHFGRDFSPITVIALVPNMVVVNAKVPARTVEEFIALAKQKPGSLNYGTAGAGTAHHLIGEMFKLEGDGHRPHTLSWKCTCADRFDRGASAGNVRYGHVRFAAGQGRHDACSRRHNGAAFDGTARRAHARRGSHTWIRCRDLVWVIGARKYRALHRGETESSGGRDRQLAGGERTHAGPWG
jgi:hypothetical protein